MTEPKTNWQTVVCSLAIIVISTGIVACFSLRCLTAYRDSNLADEAVKRGYGHYVIVEDELRFQWIEQPKIEWPPR